MELAGLKLASTFTRTKKRKHTATYSNGNTAGLNQYTKPKA
jgi:hypothetical protein